MLNEITNLKEVEEQVDQQDQGEEQSSKSKRKITYERQFIEYLEALELTASDPGLNAYATEYGYGDTRLTEGLTMGSQLESMYEEQKRAKAAQLAATKALEQKKQVATASLSHLLQTAKLAFKNDDNTYKALELGLPRKKAYGDWLAQSKYFYTTLLGLPDAIAEMANYSVTPEQIDAGYQQLLEVHEAAKVQKNAIAESQRATEQKNILLKQFTLWMKRFFNVMEVALYDDCQMKEKLGIVTASAA